MVGAADAALEKAGGAWRSALPVSLQCCGRLAGVVAVAALAVRSRVFAATTMRRAVACSGELREKSRVNAVGLWKGKRSM